ncbi:MAG: hypothetical protein Kow00109_28640 [Acidobacteriota bacterium]
MFWRASRRTWLLLGAAGVLGAFLLRLAPMSDDPRLTPCFFRRATGLACPGCGLTRSLQELSRGRWTEAQRYHPLGPWMAATAAGLWIAWGLALARGATDRLLPWLSPGLLLFAALLVTVWLVRLVRGTLPP